MENPDFATSMDLALNSLAKKAAEMGFTGENKNEEDNHQTSTGVMTSQLRYFVIQVRLRL